MFSAVAVCVMATTRVQAQQATLGGDTRAQLAAAYLRLELALRDHPLTSENAASVNRAFDAATLAFFAGKTAQTIHTVDSLTAAIEPDRSRQVLLGREAAERLSAMLPLRRTVTTTSGDVPFRLHVPRGKPSATPRPLVVALHGTGGDENMFLEGYGAGRIAELADRYNVIVVSPLTGALARSAESLDALVAEVSRTVTVDSSRISVIGHSLGAGVAWRLALQRPQLVSAVVCLAGGCGGDVAGVVTPTRTPRALVLSAELDPLAAPVRVKTGVDAGRAAGRAITYDTLPGYGHTLMVGELLPRVFAWLFDPS